MSSIIPILSIFLCQISIVVFSKSLNSIGKGEIKTLYWNHELFNDYRKEHAYLRLDAHIGDSVEIVCPATSTNSTTKRNGVYMHSIIYKVSSKYEFDNCLIDKNNKETVQILTCDKPDSKIQFTTYLVSFSPVPNALEFKENEEYYFLSTSTGGVDGLQSSSGGLCSKYNMRFSIKINSHNSNIKQTSHSGRSKFLNGLRELYDITNRNSDNLNVYKLNLLGSNSSVLKGDLFVLTVFFLFGILFSFE
jgi:hypothetical protein